MLDVRKKLIWLLKKNEKIVVKELNEDTPRIKEDNETVSKMERFMYHRLESVKIDENFKYYHYDLTGSAKIDFDNLFGVNDSHGSARILEHSFRENYLKIQRSHDIALTFDDGVYKIYNGRHRLIYLKAFYDAYHCKENDFGYWAPAFVNYYIKDDAVNRIINSLEKDYEAQVYKGNYYDDEISFSMVISDKIYVVRNKEELEEFHELLKVGSNIEKYFLSTVSLEKKFPIEDVFQSIFSCVGQRLFEMSFIDLFFYIKENGVILENHKITLNELNIKAIYAYHLRIVESVQVCKVYGYDILDGLEITNVRNKPINVYGAIIMDFLYDNPAYQNLRWDELFEIISNFVRFRECDSEFLRESAKRFGYVEGNGQVQKRKRR